MGFLTRRHRPSMHGLRREVEDVVSDFEPPRGFRRELDRLFDEDVTPRALWRELDRLLDDFTSPPTLRRRLARVFEDFFGGGRAMGRGRAPFVPRLDIVEREDAYLLRMDLPGVREQDVDIEVDDDNVLTISGERRSEESRRDRGFEYTERSYGSFQRSIELPGGVDPDNIEASFREGVLELRLPRVERARRMRVPIRERVLGRDRDREEPKVMPSGNGAGGGSSRGEGR